MIIRFYRSRSRATKRCFSCVLYANISVLATVGCAVTSNLFLFCINALVVVMAIMLVGLIASED